MEKLLDSLEKLAQENPEGFTVYLPSLEFVSSGWVISNKATQNCFGREGLKKVVEFAMKHNRIVGGYRNAEGIFQYDSSIVEPNEQIAITLMVIHDQDAIYHLETGRLIWRE